MIRYRDWESLRFVVFNLDLFDYDSRDIAIIYDYVGRMQWEDAIEYLIKDRPYDSALSTRLLLGIIDRSEDKIDLLSRTIDMIPNLKEIDWEGLMEEAAYKGRVDVLQYLVKRSRGIALIRPRDIVKAAAEGGQLDIVRAYLTTYPWSGAGETAMYVLGGAITDINIVKYLINFTRDSGLLIDPDLAYDIAVNFLREPDGLSAIEYLVAEHLLHEDDYTNLAMGAMNRNRPEILMYLLYLPNGADVDILYNNISIDTSDDIVDIIESEEERLMYDQD
jgi:hypothetical protein